ncbi:MAG: HD domain-containing protein [Pseudoxanthomonas suwonensis]|nr:HD domain-containing protein [Pseudoxanthomonas suwonensis]
MTRLTQRFSHAVEYARVAHEQQVRKGSNIPYLYHLLAVSSLVLEYGGNEDQAIAGLLHDVIEDCGEEHEARIREQFGEAVLAIVRDCTDGTADDKAHATSPEATRRSWWQRKLAYVAHLREEPEASLLVGGCDKLHNARAITQDLADPTVGVAVFDRFKAGRDGTLRYYESIARILRQRGAPMARIFDAEVERMHRLAGAARRLPLEEAGEGHQ